MEICMIESRLKEIISNVLECPVDSIAWIDEGKLFEDYGFDSMLIVELLVKIEEEFQLVVDLDQLNSEDLETFNSIISMVNRVLSQDLPKTT
ncbi:MAG: acyl carrier protein [Bacillota bacterium]